MITGHLNSYLKVYLVFKHGTPTFHDQKQILHATLYPDNITTSSVRPNGLYKREFCEISTTTLSPNVHGVPRARLLFLLIVQSRQTETTSRFAERKGPSCD